MNTTVRDTSIEAYTAVMESGFVAETALEVYNCLYHNGPMTQNEVWQRIDKDRKKDSYGPRFATLERSLLIRDIGIRQCRISGRRCHVWDVTSNLPTKPATRKARTFYIVKRGSLIGDAYSGENQAKQAQYLQKQAYPDQAVELIKTREVL